MRVRFVYIRLVANTRSFVFVSCLVFSLGCESDEAKLTRFRSVQTAACLDEQASYSAFRVVADSLHSGGLLRDLDAARAKGDSLKVASLDSAYQLRHRNLGADSAGEKWQRDKSRCELATRDVDRMLK